MSFSSVAEYSRTAIETSPNDTAPRQIARMASAWHSSTADAPLRNDLGSDRGRAADQADARRDGAAAGRPGVGLRAQVGRYPGDSRDKRRRSPPVRAQRHRRDD